MNKIIKQSLFIDYKNINCNLMSHVHHNCQQFLTVDYTWIHLSPWWMLFRSHIDIYRFWSIFFTYSLTLYDGAILFSDDYWIEWGYWLWSEKIKKTSPQNSTEHAMFVDLSSCAHCLSSWYIGSAHSLEKVMGVISRLGGAGVYTLNSYTIGLLTNGPRSCYASS